VLQLASRSGTPHTQGETLHCVHHVHICVHHVHICPYPTHLPATIPLVQVCCCNCPSICNCPSNSSSDGIAGSPAEQAMASTKTTQFVRA